MSTEEQPIMWEQYWSEPDPLDLFGKMVQAFDVLTTAASTASWVIRASSSTAAFLAGCDERSLQEYAKRLNATEPRCRRTSWRRLNRHQIADAGRWWLNYCIGHNHAIVTGGGV